MKKCDVTIILYYTVKPFPVIADPSRHIEPTRDRSIAAYSSYMGPKCPIIRVSNYVYLLLIILKYKLFLVISGKTVRVDLCAIRLTSHP